MSALQASASANGRLSKEKQLERKKRERPNTTRNWIILLNIISSGLMALYFP